MSTPAPAVSPTAALATAPTAAPAAVPTAVYAVAFTAAFVIAVLDNAFQGNMQSKSGCFKFLNIANKTHS